MSASANTPLNLKIEFKPLGAGAEKLSAEIPLILPSGGYKQPSTEIWSGPDAGTTDDTKWLDEWLMESGLILDTTSAEDATAIRTLARQYCVGAMYLIPSLAPNNEKLKLFQRFLALTNLIRDILTKEQKGKDGQVKELTKDKTMKLQGLLIGGEIIEGKFKSIDDLPKGLPIPPEYKAIMQSYLSIAQNAHTLIFDFGNLCKQLATRTNDSFTGLGVLLTQQFLDGASPLPIPVYNRMHAIAVGIEPMIEMGCLVAGISLSPDVRSHVLFGQGLGIAAGILDSILELLGLPEAVDAAAASATLVDNTILYRSKQNPKLGLGGALQDHVAELRASVQSFMSICDVLRKTNPKNKRMDKFLNVIENIIDGSIYWLSGPHNGRNTGGFKAQVVPRQ